MKNHIKMGPYTSLATLRLAQENHLENVRKMKNRKVYKAKKQATNPVRKVKLLHEKELKKGWSIFDLMSVMLITRPSGMCTLTPDTRIQTCVMIRKLIVGSIIRRLGCSGMQLRCDLWIVSIVGCQSNHIPMSPSSE